MPTDGTAKNMRAHCREVGSFSVQHVHFTLVKSNSISSKLTPMKTSNRTETKLRALYREREPKEIVEMIDERRFLSSPRSKYNFSCQKLKICEKYFVIQKFKLTFVLKIDQYDSFKLSEMFRRWIRWLSASKGIILGISGLKGQRAGCNIEEWHKLSCDAGRGRWKVKIKPAWKNATFSRVEFPRTARLTPRSFVTYWQVLN